MTGTMRKQLTFLIGFTLLGLITVALVKSVRSQKANPQDTSSDDVEAIRRGGLREAARIRGHYVGIRTTSYFLKYDIESLAAQSGDIIMGSPIDNTTHLSSDGQMITTWHRVKILQTLKGKLQPDETVTVSLPGGKVVFEDGTSAEIKTPDLEGMQNDQKYILFLSPMLRAGGAFSVIGGSQGLFEIDNKTRRVKPNGHPLDPVQKHREQGVDAFLEEIRAAVKKYPEATTCCN
jgi:hypothetical protein